MGKFYDENYDEVTAFSQEELEAKLAEEKKKLEETYQQQVAEKEKEIADKQKEYEDLSKRYDSRKKEYENLKKKYEETDQTLNSTQEEKKITYDKLVQDTIKKAAGDDTEYAETFEERYRKFYGDEDSLTLDPSVIEERAKEIHAITISALERDFTPFSLGSAGTGEPPKVKSNENQSFTETKAGKDTFEHVLVSMGQDPSAAQSAENDKSK